MNKGYSNEFYDAANNQTLFANKTTKRTKKLVLAMVYAILDSVANQLCEELDKNLEESYVDENFASENFVSVTDEMLDKAFEEASKRTGKHKDTVKALVIGTNGFHLPIHDFCNMLPEFMAREIMKNDGSKEENNWDDLSAIMLESLKNLDASQREIKANLEALRINIIGGKMDKTLIKTVVYQLLESLYKYVGNNVSTTNENISKNIIKEVAQATNQNEVIIKRIIEEKIGMTLDEVIKLFIDYLQNDSKELIDRMYNGLKKSDITKKEIKQKLETLKTL